MATILMAASMAMAQLSTKVAILSLATLKTENEMAPAK